MKKKRSFGTTGVAAICVAALAGYAYFVEYKGKNAESEKKEKATFVLPVDRDKITALEIYRASGPLKLKKESNQWRLTEPLQDLADDGAINSLLNSLVSEKTQQLVAEGDDAKNLSIYGLESPVTRLIVHGEDGFTREVDIGSVKSFDSQLYALIDHGPQVWLVAGNWDIYLTKPVKELRDKHVMRNELLELDEIKATIAGRGAWTLKNNTKSWEFTQGGDPSIPLANAQVTRFHELLRDLQGDDIVSEDKAKDQSKFALQAPQARITLRKGEKQFEMLISSKKPGDINPSDKSLNESWRYAVGSDSPYVFRISKAMADGVMKEPEDFYDHEAPFKLSQENVRTIEIKKGPVAIKVKKIEKNWTLSEPIAGKELDSAKVDDLLGRISVLDADRILSKTKGDGVQDGENQIVLKDEKGEKLLQINWGSEFAEKGENGSKTKYYYVETDKSEHALLLKDVKIDEMPIAGLLKDKVATK